MFSAQLEHAVDGNVGQTAARIGFDFDSVGNQREIFAEIFQYLRIGFRAGIEHSEKADIGFQCFGVGGKSSLGELGGQYAVARG
jgi:hypothetical protein